MVLVKLGKGMDTITHVRTLRCDCHVFSENYLIRNFNDEQRIENNELCNKGMK